MEQRYGVREVILTALGKERVAALGRAGKLVYAAHAPGTGDSWEIRKEDPADNRMCFVLYYNGQVYDRYNRAESVYTVFRSHCPRTENVEASLSR